MSWSPNSTFDAQRTNRGQQLRLTGSDMMRRRIFANFSPSIDRDENGIIVAMKWCGLLSLGIKASCPLSARRAEKTRDKRDLIGNALNESPLRHQPTTASHVLRYGERDRAAPTGGPGSTSCDPTHADAITTVSFQGPF